MDAKASNQNKNIADSCSEYTSESLSNQEASPDRLDFFKVTLSANLNLTMRVKNQAVSPITQLDLPILYFLFS